MRTLLLSMVFLPWAACAPKVSTAPTRFDDVEPNKHQALPPPVQEEPAAPPRPEAPLGKGIRSGTIPRSRLIAVLDAGIGAFLDKLQTEITAKKQGERFVGWEVVQVRRASPLAEIDVVAGDVLLAINGKPISRPDQLHAVWESLRTATEVTAQLWRGNDQLTLAFTVDAAQ